MSEQVKSPSIGWGMDFMFGKITTVELFNGLKTSKRRIKSKKASVVGVVFTLDYCLDLLDSEFIGILAEYYSLMRDDLKLIGKELPKNKDVKEDQYKDLLIRELDCSVIEYLHQKNRGSY